VDFYETVGSTVLHHDFHTASLFPFWTDEIPALRTGGFVNEAVLREKSYLLVDDVYVVNPDHSETFLESHPASVDLDVVFQHPTGDAVPIAGLTEPTLVDGIVPIPVPQEPFSGQMHLDTATANFRATAWNADGSLYRSFHTEGVKSAFSEIGTETIGSP
jgi:hypothetical protein